MCRAVSLLVNAFYVLLFEGGTLWRHALDIGGGGVGADIFFYLSLVDLFCFQLVVATERQVH